MTDVVRVCVVCAGNICRSPMAEAVLRAKLDAAGLGDRVEVDSAGTGDWHLGQPAHARSTAALRRRGYTIDHRARQFDRTWFGERDLVLALDAQNLRDLARLAPSDFPAARLRLLRASPGGSSGSDPSIDPAGDRDRDARWDTDWDVPDPYGQDDRAYDHALDLIEAAADAIVDELATQLAQDPAGAPSGPPRSR